MAIIKTLREFLTKNQVRKGVIFQCKRKQKAEFYSRIVCANRSTVKLRSNRILRFIQGYLREKENRLFCLLL